MRSLEPLPENASTCEVSTVSMEVSTDFATREEKRNENALCVSPFPLKGRNEKPVQAVVKCKLDFLCPCSIMLSLLDVLDNKSHQPVHGGGFLEFQAQGGGGRLVLRATFRGRLTRRKTSS